VFFDGGNINIHVQYFAGNGLLSHYLFSELNHRIWLYTHIIKIYEVASLSNIRTLVLKVLEDVYIVTLLVK
jgi:hypothetical protein